MIRTSVATSQNINSLIKGHCHIITRNCIKKTERASAGESVTVVIIFQHHSHRLKGLLRREEDVLAAKSLSSVLYDRSQKVGSAIGSVYL